MSSDTTTTHVAEDLAAILGGMRPRLDSAELENYKLLLCMAAGGLAPRGASPRSAAQTDAFRAVLTCLKDMRIGGTMWRGRPGFLTDGLLSELQRESRHTREIAKPTDRYLLGCGGQVADRFAMNDQLAELVAGQFPGVHPTGIASYIYYDSEGQGLDPHVDTEIYAVNVILMLEHVHFGRSSHLLVYDEDVAPERIQLNPGELLILNAGSVVHAREDMGQGERVGILTIGFASE